MSQEVTLGGDRLGSGNKQKVSLHNYEMSSFNQEQDFKSSMAPGILYPCLKLIGTNHDTFDIDVDSIIRTLPTKGPLFGSYKFQVDLFSCPMRLYQGILHNNPVGIGLKMNQVYFPKLELELKDHYLVPTKEGSNNYNNQVNESSLLKYLGLSGIGTNSRYESLTPTDQTIKRKINCIPHLAYYDIFKCYYSNKQEEMAYVITPGEIVTAEGDATVYSTTATNAAGGGVGSAIWFPIGEELNFYYNQTNNGNLGIAFKTASNKQPDPKLMKYTVTWFRPAEDPDDDPEQETWGPYTLQQALDEEDPDIVSWTWNKMNNIGAFTLKLNQLFIPGVNMVESEYVTIKLENAQTSDLNESSGITLTPFELTKIDDMRNELLSANTLGYEYVIKNTTHNDFYPYGVLVNKTANGISWNAFPENGLVVKTYQSDLFNNWLDSEYITGEQGISKLSAVKVDANGYFTMDQLNLSEKVYEVLNRIAVSGGTYEDWQEAVYGEGAVRKAETPMYMGGLTSEILFEEVISNAETNVDGDHQALGSLGGRGINAGKKGGNNIHIKCEEPTYIIGIASITPRICYTQGNDWDLTDLDTFDDLHKPGLDGIGFQDLMVEQMAWWDAKIDPRTLKVTRNSAGKQTAWINYQTAVDKAFGDFAKTEGKAFMVLSRNYEFDEEDRTVKDVTTYIDPAKYNYAFAYAKLDAQNFWVQIHFNVVARRKMGARQIPNL